MGELINLKRARKRRDKQTAEREADANRVRFGRTKSERAADEAGAEKNTKQLDQHKLTPRNSI